MLTLEGFNALTASIVACGVPEDLAAEYAACIGDTPVIMDGWLEAGGIQPGDPPPIRLPISVLGEDGEDDEHERAGEVVDGQAD